MRKLIIILFCLALVIVFFVPAMAKGGKDKCATIKDGTIEYGRVNDPSTEIIPIGYDQWGYNYQAHLFNGLYWNNSRPEVPWTEETLIAAGKSTTWLNMKWSDEWLSNKDCNGDEKLDRGYSCNPDNSISSACDGAWETNHQWGSYEDEETEEICNWYYFVKIVYVSPEYGYKAKDPVDDVLYWYTIEGDEKIGSVIWTSYARILQIYNDPCAGETGVENKWETPVGFGYFK